MREGNGNRGTQYPKKGHWHLLSCTSIPCLVTPLLRNSSSWYFIPVGTADLNKRVSSSLLCFVIWGQLAWHACDLPSTAAAAPHGCHLLAEPKGWQSCKPSCASTGKEHLSPLLMLACSKQLLGWDESTRTTAIRRATPIPNV